LRGSGAKSWLPAIQRAARADRETIPMLALIRCTRRLVTAADRRSQRNARAASPYCQPPPTMFFPQRERAMAGEEGRPSGRFDWIDYARLACALVVMSGHYLLIVPDPRVGHGIAIFGEVTTNIGLGIVAVLIFLMMSGMVITLVAQRESASTFVARRFARIYPIFLICMTATSLVTQIGPERLRVSFPQYLANLAIDAPLFGYRFVDTVYWSMVIEIIFYLAMTLVILSGAIRRIQTVVTIWVLLQVACAMLALRIPLLGIDYAFLTAGAVMALWYQRRHELLNLALIAISLLLCLRCTAIYVYAYQANQIAGAVVTASFFALFMFMRGRSLRLPLAQRIGSMTYVLYLLHFDIGLTIFYHMVTEANKWWMVIGVGLGMLAVSFALDELLEFRLRKLWIKLAMRTVARPFAWLEALRPERREDGG
jgi:peptidoglycan/LPS O-acetylase OafA/YrhL